jgi:RHS repeat-associated protein
MTSVHNAQGQRVKKQIGSQPAVYYAYDLQGQLLGEYTLNGTQYKPVIEYIWLEGQPVAAVRPTPGAPANAGNSAQEVFYLHTDHLGTPRVALDTAGRLRWRWMGGEPFGVNPAENNPEGLGELNLSLRLPGQQYDGFVGLHYNYFRDYDPTVGRYVQSDPIGLKGGLNTYGYVSGNPLSRVDPLGLLDQPGINPDGPDNKDQPRPGDYPPMERRPYVPPPPPRPPQPNPGEPWPGPDGWRGQCIRLYALCQQQDWTGNCGVCLNKCTAQQEWPFDGPVSCKPKQTQCRVR